MQELLQCILGFTAHVKVKSVAMIAQKMREEMGVYTVVSLSYYM